MADANGTANVCIPHKKREHMFCIVWSKNDVFFLSHLPPSSLKPPKDNAAS